MEIHLIPPGPSKSPPEKGVTSIYGKDTNKLLKLRLEKHLTYDQISELTGMPKTTVYERLSWFEKLVKDPEQLQAYREQRGVLLSGVEAQLLTELANSDKLEKASLNNVAYAFGQIHMARRLEEGKSTSNLSIHALLIEVACAGKVEDAGDEEVIDV